MGLGILGVSQDFYRTGGVQLRTQMVKHSPKSNPTPCKKYQTTPNTHKKNNYTLYKRSVVVKKNKIIVTKHQKQMEECIGRDGVGINGRGCGGVWEPTVAVNGGLRSEWWWLGESSAMWRVGGVRGS